MTGVGLKRAPASARAILIAGPTAAGKSAIAMRLAEAFDGVVVNADSMQVYRELRILTARPSPEDESRCPHRLYGHRSAAEPYSTGAWASEAAEVIADLGASGRLPVFVGGTGLYFRALLEGLSPIPSIPSGVRDRWREAARHRAASDLHAELQSADPVMAARLSPSDPQRIVRALEVIEATGRSLADWQAVPGQPLIDPAHTMRIVVGMDRTELYERCNQRTEQMMAAGALEEVRALMGLGLDGALPAMRALGVRQLMEHVRGETSLTDAVERVKTETRHYAKRQLTWLKSNMVAWNWFFAQHSESLEARIFSFVEGAA